MTKEELQTLILQQAVEKAENSFLTPVNASPYFGFGANNLNLVNALATLNDHIKEKGGVDQPNNATPQEVKHVARAAAFTTSVVSNAYMAGFVKKSIDEFMLDPNNEQLINDALKNATPEQRQAFAQNLKDTVTDKLSIDAKTNEGKAFVDIVTKKFNQAVTPDDLKALFGSGIAAANRMLSQLDTGTDKIDSVKQALTETKEAYTENGNNTIEYDHSFDDIIIENLGYRTDALSYENGGYLTQDYYNIPIFIDSKNDAKKLQDFLKAYDEKQDNPNWLSEDMNLWVQDKMQGFKPNELSSAMVDGKQLYNSQQLSRLSEAQIKAEVLASALKGKKVTYPDPQKDTEELFSPQITGTKPKTLLEKIIDFFKQLLGFDEFSEMKRDIQNAKESHLSNNPNLREKTSFNEMSGLNALDKVNSTVTKGKETVAEKETPEKKAPEMNHR